MLSVLLTASVVSNVLLWKAGERQLLIKEVYFKLLSEWRSQIIKTWIHMKMLDDKQMFEKDDEVGVVFQDMKDLIQSLSENTEEIAEEGE